jgi:hypothetical protein
MRCEKCGEEFSSEEIDNHNLTCSYAFSNKDYEDLIPCEICNEFISFSDYSRHVSICSRPRLPQIPIFNLNNFPDLQNNEGLNIINSNIGDLGSGEELQNNLNIINNDPIARTLFSLMIGNLPQNINQEPEQHQNQDNDELNENNDVENNDVEPMDIDESSEQDEDEDEGNEEYNFFTNNTLEPPLPPVNPLPVPPYNNDILGLLENILNELPIQHNQNQNQNQNQNLDEDNYEELINLEDHVVGISNINDISELSFEEIDCPICSETKMVKRTTNCNHSFCDLCLQEWLQSSKKCPICMVELE